MSRSWRWRDPLTIYMVFVLLAGSAATIGSVYVLARDLGRAGVTAVDSFNAQSWLQWWAFLTLTVVCARLVMKIPGIPANFTVSDTFTITSAVLCGPEAATAIVALDCLMISRRLVKSGLAAHRIAFNATAPALAMWLTAHVLPAMAAAGSPVDGYPSVGVFAFRLAFFVVGYFVLNTGGIAIAVALENRLSPLAVWRTHFLSLWLTYFGGGAAAGLVFLLMSTHSSGLAVFGMFLPLPLVIYAFRHSMGRLDDQLHHLADLNDLYLSTIEALAQAIDAKDHFTHGHIRRVQMYAMRLAHELGVKDEAELKAVKAAALLHDMGKIGVPEHILNKPGKLTTAEYEKVKVHAALGADILSSIKFPYPVVPIVRHHHERWDGRGYPDGLAGTNIPLGARILSVVDCFDALTTDRPYRPALSDVGAVAVLLDGRGEAYDPVVVDAFIKVFREVAVHEAVSVLPADAADAIARTFHSAPVAADLRPASVHDDVAAGAFFDMGAALAPARTVDDVGAAVWLCTRRMMRASTCLLYVANGDDRLNVAFAAGEHARTLLDVEMPFGHKLSGWVAANRSTMVNADALLDIGDLSSPLDPPLHSCASSPMNVDGLSLGALTVYSTATAAFTDRDGRVLEALAARVAAAVVRIKSIAA